MDTNRGIRILSTVGIILILAAVIFFGYRMFAGARTQVESWIGQGTEGPSNRVSVPTDGALRDFESIVSQGGWTIVLTPGDFSVTVGASERVADDVDVFASDGVLHLGLAPGFRTGTQNLRAEISMPSLRRIRVAGGADVHIRDLETGYLEIEVDGAASVRAVDGRFAELRIEVDGATNIDFSQSSVVDASVDMDGASNLSVHMDGGRLTGVLRGVGNVHYTGTVSEESITVEGLGRVRAK